MSTTPAQLDFYPPAVAPSRMAVCERPRNRAKQSGTGALSDVEVLALVLQGAGEEPEDPRAGLAGNIGEHEDHFDDKGAPINVTPPLIAGLIK